MSASLSGYPLLFIFTFTYSKERARVVLKQINKFMSEKTDVLALFNEGPPLVDRLKTYIYLENYPEYKV